MRSGIPLSNLNFGAAQAADKIIGGPYVVNPAARSATIAWVVETSSVKVGDAPDKLTTSVPVLRCEKISLTGLKPGTTVHYEIPVPGDNRGRFKTPPTGPADFQFVVFGDTRSRHDLHRKVIEAIARTEPDFVLHTGDLVFDAYDTTQWPIFFSIEKKC